MNLNNLYSIILKRKKEKPENSYIVSLLRNGTDCIAQKIGEEATEVIIAAKNSDKKAVIYEVADLWFHTLILLAANRITPDDIYSEFEKRNKQIT